MLRCKGGIGQKNNTDLYGSPILKPYSGQSCIFSHFKMTFGKSNPIFGSVHHSYLNSYPTCVCNCQGSMASCFWHRSCTDLNGIPSSRSYRSPRMNQNASPPVLWLGPDPFWVALTPREPFRPVLRQPLACMIIRTTTPTACLRRLLLFVCISAKERSMTG